MPTHDTAEKKDFRPGLAITSAVNPETPTNPVFVTLGYARSVKREALEAADRLSWHAHNPGMQSIDYQTRTSVGTTGATQTIYYWQLVRTTHTDDGVKVETTYFLTKDSGVIGRIQSTTDEDSLAPVIDLQSVNVEVLKMLLFALTRLG